MQKRAIFLVAVSAICAFAEKDYDKAIEPFQNSPGSVLTEAAWIEPHDEMYLPYNACSEVQGLDFVKLEEQVPTVEECKAYGGLKSAQAQFAWRR